MDTVKAEYKDKQSQKIYEEMVGNIFQSQGYCCVSLFNDDGKKLSVETCVRSRLHQCSNNEGNKGFCDEHYIAAKELTVRRRKAPVFCANDKEKILLTSPLITSAGKNLGVIVGCKKNTLAGLENHDSEISFLKGISTLLADRIYQNIEIQSLAEDLDTKFEEIALLYEIGERTQISDNVDDSIKHVIERAIEVIGSSLVVWSVPDKGKNSFYKNHERESCDDEISKEIIEKICNKVMRLVSRSKKPLVLNNLNKYREFTELWQKPANLLSIPLTSSNKEYGALNFIELNPERIFINDQLKLIESISRSTVVLLKNSELYGKLQKLFFSVIHMLLGIIENKDSYTEGHSKRVYKISVEFAKLLGLSSKDIFDLKWAAILHDIGKITVPSILIKKPERLTLEEFNIIKLHPLKGAELISIIDEFKDSIKGIRHHHERMDGKGYPDGLAGEKIPLIARIISIADTFDALNSARPYREQPSHDFVFEELKRSTPEQFDPMLMDMFLKNYDNFFKLLNMDEDYAFNEIDFKGIW